LTGPPAKAYTFSMIKRIFLFIALLWELVRAAGLFFLFNALLNPVFRTEETLMLGWLFSGSLVIAAAEAVILFSGSEHGDHRQLHLFAALGKALAIIPGLLLLTAYSGMLLSAEGPWLLAPWRPIIVIVSLLDLLCILFLLLLKESKWRGSKRSVPDRESPEITMTTLEEE
jgi:hypothetical protein